MIIKKIVIITEDEAEEKVLRKILADQEPDVALADENLEWQKKIREKFDFGKEKKVWCKLQYIADMVAGEEADRSAKLKIKAALESMNVKTKKVHNLTWWFMPVPPGVEETESDNPEEELPLIPTPFDEIPHKQTLAEIMKGYKKREV